MTKGLPLGVEFSGGTIVIVQFDQQPPDSSAVRAALERAMPGEGQNAVIQRYGDDAQRQVHDPGAERRRGGGRRPQPDGRRASSRR